MANRPKQRPVRFVHTSDLHLEQPLHGIDEIPEHLEDQLLDAPFQAAERVFDVAVEEQVDFVILAGDIILPLSAGPRGLDFLLQQFARLRDANISVYWVRGQTDDFDDWPLSVPIPGNVIRFADEHVESITHHRGNQPIAVIQGRASNDAMTFFASEFDSDATLPTIAAVYGTTADALHRSDIDYWALGGVHSSRPGSHQNSMGEDGATIRQSAWYSGSPQGRRPVESGPHGCLLVEVDADGELSRQVIETDAVRWHNLVFELPDAVDRSGLLRMLREQTHGLMEASGGRQIFIRWVLRDGDELSDTRSDLIAARLREGGLAMELLESLRTEFGMTIPGAWHLEIDVEPPSVLPSGWYEEDTVLGDLLRSVQHYQKETGHPYPVEALPADAKISEDVAALLRAKSSEDREMILRRVAALGVDLLRGDRVLSEESEERATAQRTMAGGL